MLDPFWISQSLKCSIWFQILWLENGFDRQRERSGQAKNNNKSCSSPHSLVMEVISKTFSLCQRRTPSFQPNNLHSGAVTCFWGEFDINRKSNRQTRLSMGAAYNTGYWGKILWYSPISPSNLQIHPTNKHQTPATIVPVQGLSHFSKMLMALMWYKTLLQWHYLDWKVAIVKKIYRESSFRLKKMICRYQYYISLCSFRIGGNQLISSCTSQGGGTGGCQGLAWEIKKVWQCLLEMISIKSFWNMLIVGRQYMVQWVGSDPVIICRAVQLIHIPLPPPALWRLF